MPRAVLRGASSALVFLIVAAASPSVLAKPVRIHLFNLNPDHTYRVQRNGATHADVFSGGAGSLVTGLDAAVGDFISASDQGAPDLQPPAPPVFASLETGLPGCAAAAWAPSGDPTVVAYVVSFGRAPGVYDDTVEVTAGASVEVCSLLQGMHYFAVQCRNYAGMLGPYSAERSVEIVVVSVLIAQFDARVAADGVALTWRVEADEHVAGFRIYRAGADHMELPLTTELLPAAANTYLDGTARPGASYTYAVAAVNGSGEETRSFTVSVAMPALALSLGQNAPNPFSPATTIPFVLDATTRVLLRVYDVRGALVATLHDGVLPEGRHAIAWNGRNDAGRAVSSGTYLYALVAGKQRLARKMLVVR